MHIHTGQQVNTGACKPGVKFSADRRWAGPILAEAGVEERPVEEVAVVGHEDLGLLPLHVVEPGAEEVQLARNVLAFELALELRREIRRGPNRACERVAAGPARESVEDGAERERKWSKKNGENLQHWFEA